MKANNKWQEKLRPPLAQPRCLSLSPSRLYVCSSLFSYEGHCLALCNGSVLKQGMPGLRVWHATTAPIPHWHLTAQPHIALSKERECETRIKSPTANASCQNPAKIRLKCWERGGDAKNKRRMINLNLMDELNKTSTSPSLSRRACLY
ncbi:hypothetical protein E2C01_074038 [Portunus trituberculatus]|uniref:Uncharacterized protein n=1 Tax=Portunus trituberculatus TaxID=210409 RepID=A0A5B7ICA4_PORTR|nr:hypothetical protein [Portunus trituberculatus]